MPLSLSLSSLLSSLLFAPAPAPAPTTSTSPLATFFAQTPYAADLSLELCAAAFPAADHWTSLFFFPAARACVRVPGFAALIAGLGCVLGVLWVVGVVLGGVWIVLRGFGWGVRWGLDAVVGLAGSGVEVVGGWLGMREEGGVGWDQ
ncbi:hypothetical protein IMSHALPRED_005884 [Imshaugia aleurites]|uniref:Uncharacterized protein n=1 Tax=Imshaugia aleurites TaxID=172621 RepID=A0A8H3FGV6_9LECA|nr:hypothetical protein IMSHALPRED_005884 [Imshaugia aleurites]